MDTYYCPHDLARFGDMGKNRPELWSKYMAYYEAVFADGALGERLNLRVLAFAARMLSRNQAL